MIIISKLRFLKKKFLRCSKNDSNYFKYLDSSQDLSAIKLDFVDTQFMARDSIAFRDHINKVAPDIDFSTKVKLSDGKEQEVTVPMTVRFFWPNAEV